MLRNISQENKLNSNIAHRDKYKIKNKTFNKQIYVILIPNFIVF